MISESVRLGQTVANRLVDEAKRRKKPPEEVPDWGGPTGYTPTEFQAFLKLLNRREREMVEAYPEDLNAALEYVAHALKPIGTKAINAGSYSYTPLDNSFVKWVASDGSEINSSILGIVAEYTSGGLAERNASLLATGDESLFVDWQVIDTMGGQEDHEFRQLRGESMNNRKFLQEQKLPSDVPSTSWMRRRIEELVGEPITVDSVEGIRDRRRLKDGDRVEYYCRGFATGNLEGPFVAEFFRIGKKWEVRLLNRPDRPTVEQFPDLEEAIDVVLGVLK